jgi:hypothetical protein
MGVHLKRIIDAERLDRFGLHPGDRRPHQCDWENINMPMLSDSVFDCRNGKARIIFRTGDSHACRGTGSAGWGDAGGSTRRMPALGCKACGGRRCSLRLNDVNRYFPGLYYCFSGCELIILRCAQQLTKVSVPHGIISLDGFRAAGSVF